MNHRQNLSKDQEMGVAFHILWDYCHLQSAFLEKDNDILQQTLRALEIQGEGDTALEAEAQLYSKDR